MNTAPRMDVRKKKEIEDRGAKRAPVLAATLAASSGRLLLLLMRWLVGTYGRAVVALTAAPGIHTDEHEGGDVTPLSEGCSACRE